MVRSRPVGEEQGVEIVAAAGAIACKRWCAQHLWARSRTLVIGEEQDACDRGRARHLWARGEEQDAEIGRRRGDCVLFPYIGLEILYQTSFIFLYFILHPSTSLIIYYSLS